MHECVRKENTVAMKILIDNGVKLDMKDVDGETPTFVAAMSKGPEPVRLLLKAGANRNGMGGDGWTCVMVATRDGNYGTTKALLDAGADLYLGRDMFGRTAMGISSQQASGKMGLHMSEGESPDAAMARHKRVAALLAEYADRC